MSFSIHGGLDRPCSSELRRCHGTRRNQSADRLHWHNRGGNWSRISADTQSGDYKKLKSEYLELKDRSALAPLLPDIKAQIARLKENETINTALKATAKKPITDKNKELSDRMVTDALGSRERLTS